MVYRAGHAALTMFEQPDAVVEQAFLDDLYAIYPEARGIVSETILLKLPRMLPYAAPGPLGAAAGARASARPHPPGRRLPGRRLHRYRDLERAGSGAGRADGAAGRRSPDPEEARVRSRFDNVVNARDVPQEDYSEPSGRYQVAGREIAEVVGARDLGYSVRFVAPGSRSNPFHFHHGEEEAFYVARGPRAPAPGRRRGRGGADRARPRRRRRLPRGHGHRAPVHQRRRRAVRLPRDQQQGALRRGRVPRLRQGARSARRA